MRAGVCRLLVAAAVFAAARSERYIAASPWGTTRRAAKRLGVAALVATAGVEAQKGDPFPSGPASLSGALSDKVVQRLLAQYDFNGDGMVDKEEYTSFAQEWLEKYGMTHRILVEILFVTEKFFEAADITGDGVLNHAELEYLHFLRNIARPIPPQEDNDVAEYNFGHNEAVAIFQRHDLDNNGTIDLKEYVTGMRTFAEAWRWLDNFEASEMTQWMGEVWARVDVNGDQQLNLNEVQYLSQLVDRDAHAGLFSDQALSAMIIKDLDQNRDGRITFEEVNARIAELPPEAAGDRVPPAPLGPEDLRQEQHLPKWRRTHVGIIRGVEERFKKFDTNRDGSLNRGEVMMLARSLLVDL